MGEQVYNPTFKLIAHFHPELPILLVEKLQPSDDSVQIVDCPSALTHFEWDDLTDENIIWPTELLVSTRIRTIFPKYAQQFMGFRRCDGGTLLDMICIEGIEVPKSCYLSFSHLGELTVETPFSDIDGRNFQCCTAAGCPKFLKVIDLERIILFLRMPDGFGEEPTWIRLKLPDDLRFSYEGDIVAFDDVYGTLLLNAGGSASGAGHLSIVQY